MKNAILVIASLVVGYGFAYFCASKHMAPFNKIAAETAQAIKMGESLPPVQIKLKQASQAEVERLSNNYVKWISDLAAMASKGVPKKDLKNQIIVRGGLLSAGLIGMLASYKKDVHYIFGKESYSSPIYLLLSNPEISGSTDKDPPPVSVEEPFMIAIDSASMCPPICPWQPIPCPPLCNDPVPFPPTEPVPGG